MKKLILLILFTASLFAQNGDKGTQYLSQGDMFYYLYQNTKQLMRVGVIADSTSDSTGLKTITAITCSTASVSSALPATSFGVPIKISTTDYINAPYIQVDSTEGFYNYTIIKGGQLMSNLVLPYNLGVFGSGGAKKRVYITSVVYRYVKVNAVALNQAEDNAYPDSLTGYLGDTLHTYNLGGLWKYLWVTVSDTTGGSTVFHVQVYDSLAPYTYNRYWTDQRAGWIDMGTGQFTSSTTADGVTGYGIFTPGAGVTKQYQLNMYKPRTIRVWVSTTYLSNPSKKRYFKIDVRN